MRSNIFMNYDDGTSIAFKIPLTLSEYYYLLENYETLDDYACGYDTIQLSSIPIDYNIKSMSAYKNFGYRNKNRRLRGRYENGLGYRKLSEHNNSYLPGLSKFIEIINDDTYDYC